MEVDYLLTLEKLKEYSLSPNEKIVAKYLLKNKTSLENYSVRDIASATYVHPSTLIRLAKKLDFSGWAALKKALLKELRYLETNFTSVDANRPFHEYDTFAEIAGKIASLEQATIQDTLQLLDGNALDKTIKRLMSANKIMIYGNNANLLLAQDFILKMERLGKIAIPALTIGESMYAAYSCTSNDCSILISYSGESTEILQVAEILKKQHSPIISLTSIGTNTLKRYSDIALHLTTREKLYSKIGNYTVNASISFLFNILYSCCFSLNYTQNLDRLISIGEQIETRESSSCILKEPKNRPDSFFD